MIAAKEGTEVKAAADCKVTKISKDDEHGTLITTDIGDNYSVTYGQVDHLKVKKGDVVEEGKILLPLQNLTKYFTKKEPICICRLQKERTPSIHCSFCDKVYRKM